MDKPRYVGVLTCQAKLKANWKAYVPRLVRGIQKMVKLITNFIGFYKALINKSKLVI